MAETIKCDHDFPLVTRVADVVIGNRIKANGMIAADQYLDCLLCGPHVVRVAIFPICDADGQLVRFDGHEPFHHTGTVPQNRIRQK